MVDCLATEAVVGATLIPGASSKLRSALRVTLAHTKRSKVGAGEAVPAIGSCEAASPSRHGHVHTILCPCRVDAKGASPAQGRCQADVDRFHCLARYRFTSVRFVRWG
jgi:hypothetical protein